MYMYMYMYVYRYSIIDIFAISFHIISLVYIHNITYNVYYI